MLITWLNTSMALYVALFLFIFFSPNKTQLILNAKLQTLSRLTPPIDYFNEFIYKKDHFRQKAVDDCIYYHQRVVDFIPSHRAEAYAMMAFCQERKGQYSKAINSYKQSLKLNPAYFWTYSNLGSIYYNMGKYDEAITYYENALNQDMRVATLVPLISKVYKDVSSSELVPAYKSSVSLTRGYEDAALFLVSSLFKSGNYKKLFDVSLTLLKDGNKDTEIFMYYAGLAAYQLKLYDRAIVLLQKYVKINPLCWQGSYYLGVSLKEYGKEDYARGYLFQAENLKSKYGDILPDVSRATVKFF